MSEIIRKNNVMTEVLEWVAVLSICAVIVLRIYAAFMTQPVVSYDDKHYRGIAVYLASHMTTKEAVKDVMLPTTKRIGNRTAGYNGWLVIGLKTMENYIERERIFEIMNLLLFLFQVVFISFISLWAFRRYWLAFSVTFLYFSTPIIFGISRWIMTESFVISAFFSFPFLAFTVFRSGYKRGEKKALFAAKEILIPALAAYIMGFFSTLREYAFPSMLVVLAAFIMVMLINRRWCALAVFLSVFTPFLGAANKVVLPLLREAVAKTGINKDYIDPHVAGYVRPVSEWLFEVVFDSIGIAGLVLLLTCIGIVAFRIGAALWDSIKARNFWSKTTNYIFKDTDGYRIFFLGYLVIAIAYVTLTILATFKDQRIIILPVIALFGLLFFSVRGLGLDELIDRFSSKIKAGMFILIIGSWLLLYFHLFIAFGGGEDFYVGYKGPPIYNYPLHLRKLEAFGDWHVRDNRGNIPKK